jgi:hypothetical protein
MKAGTGHSQERRKKKKLSHFVCPGIDAAGFARRAPAAAGAHQILARSSGLRHIGSPSLIPKAS